MSSVLHCVGSWACFTLLTYNGALCFFDLLASRRHASYMACLSYLERREPHILLGQTEPVLKPSRQAYVFDFTIWSHKTCRFSIPVHQVIKMFFWDDGLWCLSEILFFVSRMWLKGRNHVKLLFLGFWEGRRSTSSLFQGYYPSAKTHRNRLCPILATLTACSGTLSYQRQ